MKNNALREFIRNRRNELLRQISTLQSELKELDLAQSAIGDHMTETFVADTSLREIAEAGQVARPRLRSKKTIKQMAVDMLCDKPNGATAIEIIELIHERFGVDVPRASISPQLSRLKLDGEVEYTNNKWSLPQHLIEQNEAPPEGGASKITGEGDASPNESRRNFFD